MSLMRFPPRSIQWSGVILVAYLIVLIAVGHIVVRASFALGWWGVPLYLIPGLVLLGLSLIEERPLLSVIYAVTSAVALWAIVEIVQHVTDLHLF